MIPLLSKTLHDRLPQRQQQQLFYNYYPFRLTHCHLENQFQQLISLGRSTAVNIAVAGVNESTRLSFASGSGGGGVGGGVSNTEFKGSC